MRGLGAGLPDFLGRAVAGTAHPCIGSGPEFGQVAFELFHAGGGLGGGGVSLLAVGLRDAPLGLGFAAALDLFGKPGFGGGDALFGAGAYGVHLGFGRLDVTYFAQFGEGAGKGVGRAGR